MDRLKAWYTQFLARWQSTSLRNKIAFSVAVSAVLGGVILAIATTRPKQDQSVLFSNLAPDDTTEIQERLKALNVPAEAAQGGTAIMVPANQVHEARLTLASEGLPRGGGVGFELFDEQRFGESEFSEQVKYHRALEGEIARTIGHIQGVDNARVHLVLPQRSLFVNTDNEASASIIVKLKPGWKMRDEQARGIIHMAASSVRGLDPDKVTLVDGQGRRILNDDEGDMAGDALAYRQEIERQKQDQVQQLLDATLGEGVAFVRVAADVDFSKEESTQETFNPNEQVIRSEQLQEKRDLTSTATAQGVPGAASNLPGGPQAQGGTTENGVLEHSETKNYEISKLTKRRLEPVGRVSKISAAVIVDGHWTGLAGKRKFRARTAEELARIKSSVESAIGVDTARGDRVTVECEAFEASRESGPLPKTNDVLAPYKPYFPFAGVAVALLAVAGFGGYAYTKRKKQLALAEAQAKAEAAAAEKAALQEELAKAQAEAEAATLAAKEAGELPAPNTLKELNAGGADAVQRQLEASMRNEEVARLQAMAGELAAENPQVAARVIRSWIAEG